MRFVFINEGTNREIENEIGGEIDFHQMLVEFIMLKYKHPENPKGTLIEEIPDMKMRFGGVSDIDCFCEVIFGEEYSYKVYLLDDKNEIKSEKYKLVNYVNDESYDIININNLN